MSFCEVCGAELRPGGEFCPKCGALVKQITPANNSTVLSDKKYIFQQTKHTKSSKFINPQSKKSRLPLIIALCAIGIALLGGITFTLIRYFDKVRLDKEGEQIEAVYNSLNDMRNSNDYIEKDVNSQTTLLLNAINEQAIEGNIDPKSISVDTDNHVITFRYSCGYLGIEKASEYDDCYSAYAGTPSTSKVTRTYSSKDDSNDQPEALVLSAAIKSTDSLSEDYVKRMAERWNEYGVTTTVDNNVSLDDITKLKGYKLVYFFAHGVYDKDRNDTWIATNEKDNNKTRKKYSKDKEMDQVCIMEGCFGFNSKFITSHYNEGDFSGSVFYFATCELMGKNNIDNESWSKALDNVSASSFVGFHNEVMQKYANNFGNNFAEWLFEGKTTSEAYSLASVEIGKNDTEYCEKFKLPYEKLERKLGIKPSAYPVLRGKNSNTILTFKNYKGNKNYTSESTKTSTSETQETSTTPSINPLTDDQAITAIKNYIYDELGYDQYTGTAPWYVDIDEKTSSDTVVVYFRAYTGAHSYFYIDRISGDTREKVYTPDMTPGVGEGKEGATFNAWDYLNRTSSSTNPTEGSETSEPAETTPSETTTQPSKSLSTKQLAYAAYLKVLQKNKKTIKAYNYMNIFNTKKGKKSGYNYFGEKPIIQKSANKNCALCELTGDSVPELLYITSNKQKVKLHVITYDSSKKKTMEILTLSLDSFPGSYLGYSLFRTNDSKLVFFHDPGLGNGDSLGDVDVYKYDGNKMKKHQSFVAAGTDSTTFSINGKKSSYEKFKSEKQKVVKSTEQIVFYTVIYESSDSKGLISRSKKLKSVAKTYDSCAKTLKG